MTIEVPESITLADGSSAKVMRVCAKVVDAQLLEIVYTVEKASGAWSNVPLEELR